MIVEDVFNENVFNEFPFGCLALEMWKHDQRICAGIPRVQNSESI